MNLENVLLEAKLRFGYMNCWASGSAVWVALGGFRYKVTCMGDLEYIPTPVLCEHKSPDLEDLAGEPRRKRRRLDKLILDKSTQLDSEYYRVRIANDYVELRCATAKEDVIQPRTPAVTLLSRPAHSGAKPLNRSNSQVGDIFINRLADRIRQLTAESDLEEQRVRRATTVPVQDTLQVLTVSQENRNLEKSDLAGEPRRKRRRLDKLILDKSTQLDSEYYRVRIANDYVELRCATAKEDVIQPRTPAVMLLSRPARSGAKWYLGLSNPSLTILPTDRFSETEVEEIVALGFTREQAIVELRRFNGDKTQATVALFAKSLKF